MSEVEFLQLRGISRTHQLNKRYNLTVREMIELLRDYTNIQINQKRDDLIENKIDSSQKKIQFG